MTSASNVGPGPRSNAAAVIAARRPQAAARDDVLLEARAIVKEYGSTKALRGADLVLRAGRIHALMGENGAGKSTLVQILVGAAAPTSGTIALQGRLVSFDGVSEAIAAGVVPIYQQSSLFPNLSVLENLFAFETAASHGIAGTPERAATTPGAADADEDRADGLIGPAGRLVVAGREAAA